MCWCNPSIRTPCCGSSDCHPPLTKYVAGKDKDNRKDDHLDKLRETIEMLEYAHTTSEQYYDYNKVKDFIEDIYKYLRSNQNV